MFGWGNFEGFIEDVVFGGRMCSVICYRLVSGFYGIKVVFGVSGVDSVIYVGD